MNYNSVNFNAEFSENFNCGKKWKENEFNCFEMYVLVEIQGQLINEKWLSS